MSRALDNWAALAAGANRNVPMLYLGPHYYGSREAKDYIVETERIAREKHFEVIRLYNTTIQRGIFGEEQLRLDNVLVQAMVIVNWLAMLPTS